MALIDDVKAALRTTSTNQALTTEIEDIIEACKIDLVQGGVGSPIDDTDKLTKRAIILYAKANYGMSNPDMEKYQKAYDNLKALLALSKTYSPSEVE